MRTENNHLKKAAQQMELMQMAIIDLIELGLTPVSIKLGTHPSICVKPDVHTAKLKAVWTGQTIDHGARYIAFTAVVCGVQVQWQKRLPHHIINWAAIKAAI